jgi:predicted RNase H-like HicB family nuclease
MKAYDFRVLLEPDETGGYVATRPSLPGCYSQGDTVDGALDNIREAIELAWRTLCSVQALRARRTCSARRSLMRDW